MSHVRIDPTTGAVEVDGDPDTVAQLADIARLLLDEIRAGAGQLGRMGSGGGFGFTLRPPNRRRRVGHGYVFDPLAGDQLGEPAPETGDDPA